MNQGKERPNLWRPASYRIEVFGHLDLRKATWFEGLALTNDFDNNGSPVTIISGEVADQAMLHGLLTTIRDLGLPLLAVNRIASIEQGEAARHPPAELTAGRKESEERKCQRDQ
jgi:hypothetical protein